jgi:flagellar protein FlaG
MEAPPVDRIPYAAAAAPAPLPEQTAENRRIIVAVRTINKAELLGENELTFQMDRETRRPVIRVVDRQTREVIEQIPPEYVLRVAEGLREPLSE